VEIEMQKVIRKHGHDVTVIDRQPGAGMEASKRNDFDLTPFPIKRF